MSLLRRVETTQVNGVPSEFARFSSTFREDPINPGQLNKIRLRPAVLNESQERSREIVGIVNSTNNIVQIFRSSTDNINALHLTVESAEAETIIDDVEYANDATLQAAWVLAGTNLALLETNIVSTEHSSTKSMKFNFSKNDVWTFTKSSGSWDFTDVTIEFDLYQTIESAVAELSFSIDDGVNSSTLSLAVPLSQKNTWVHFAIPVAAFIGTADISIITNVSFNVIKKLIGQFAYVDNVRFKPPGGSFDLELWDMGSSLPVSGVAVLNDGTQYTTLGDLGIGGGQVASVNISLVGGVSLYHIVDFVAGVAKEKTGNVLLNKDNYYAIVMKYVDTDLSVYGTNNAINYYSSGYVANTPNNSSPIVSIGVNASAMFAVFSAEEIYMLGYKIRTYDSSGLLSEAAKDSQATVYFEDIGENVSSFIGLVHALPQNYEIDISIRPERLSVGGKFEVYYRASVSDLVVTLILDIFYLYKPIVIHD